MSQLDQLGEHLEQVKSELSLIREVLDEIRVDFQWAVQNNKLTSDPAAYLFENVVSESERVVELVEETVRDTETILESEKNQLDLFD